MPAWSYGSTIPISTAVFGGSHALRVTGAWITRQSDLPVVEARERRSNQPRTIFFFR